MKHSSWSNTSFNAYQVNILLLYPLKTWENLSEFLMFLGVIVMER